MPSRHGQRPDPSDLLIPAIGADALFVSVHTVPFWPRATGPELPFVLNVAGVLATMVLVGKAVSGRWDGVLIDDRNR